MGDNFYGPLQLVRNNMLKLIFRRHHLGAFGMIPVQGNGVEFTLSGAYAAANTFIGVYDRGAAA